MQIYPSNFPFLHQKAKGKLFSIWHQAQMTKVQSRQFLKHELKWRLVKYQQRYKFNCEPNHQIQIHSHLKNNSKVNSKTNNKINKK